VARLLKRVAFFSRLFPTATITAYLTALAAVIALPLIAFAAFLLLQLESQDRAALRREMASDAHSIGRIFERYLQELSSSARLLAVFPELERGDLEGFQNRTQGILSSESLYLLLVDETGKQLLNTRVPYGTSGLGYTSNIPALKVILKTRKIGVSNAFFGRTAQQWVFNVTMPLPLELRHVGAALILTQSTERIQTILSRETLPEGWSSAIVDQEGLVVASSGPGSLPLARPFPEELRIEPEPGEEATEFQKDGRTMMITRAPLAGFDWTVVMWGPVASVQAPILSSWRWLVGGSILFIGLSMLFAYLMAQQLGHSIRQLSRLAERIGRGEIVAPPRTKLTEVNQIGVALSNASFDRSEAEDRIHLILRELVHRTKNVLSLVQAILRQIGRQSATKEEFQEAADMRLKGLAQSVDLLTQENWSGLAIHRLIEQHLATVGVEPNQWRIDGEDFVLSISAAQNLGLVLHELATNSIKYGALSTPRGRVLIRWGDAEPRGGQPSLLLEWREEGGPQVRSPEKTGFGSIITKRHAAAAFGATVELDYEPSGLCWSLHAPWSVFRKEGSPDYLDGVSDRLAASAAE
jgi:Signal transduction histidine kinase